MELERSEHLLTEDLLFSRKVVRCSFEGYTANIIMLFSELLRRTRIWMRYRQPAIYKLSFSVEGILA